jgi:hypothetical protein
MVGISGDIHPWIDHLIFKVLRSRPKINLSMLIKKKKMNWMGFWRVRRRLSVGRGEGREGGGKVWLSEEKEEDKRRNS